MHSDHIIQTADTHTDGQPTRIVTGGVEPVPGATMVEKRDYVRKHLDHIRTALLHEPRGHRDMFGCLLTEPTVEGAHFGTLFMHNSGYMDMCGHGTIGLSTALVELGMVEVGGPETEILYDTPGGLVSAVVDTSTRPNTVSFVNVPAYVHHLDAKIEVEDIGMLDVDASYGGNHFVWFSAEQAGLELNAESANQIVDVAMRVMAAANDQLEFPDPVNRSPQQINIATALAKPLDPAHRYRCVNVFGPGQVDRSTGGTGTTACLAVLRARGEIGIGEETFAESGITDGAFGGKVLEEQPLGNTTAYLTEISGSAHLTGIHQFMIDPEDPLRDGFLVG